MLSNFYEKIWNEAYNTNDVNIKRLLDKNNKAFILDVGCGDGKKTTNFIKKIKSSNIYGIDGLDGRLKAAENRGIKVKTCNLEKKWPFEDNLFDVIISNQVIEHISDVDHYIKEIKRLLKAGGYAVISTENLSSWHNIAALTFGFQDFSHHLIKKAHIGNPLSQHCGEATVTWSAKDNSGVDDTLFPHLKIFTYYSLKKVFGVYGFKIVKGLGSGYYPLFGSVGRFASAIDPYHSHFITIKVYKPNLQT